jgi:hypothetical protein
MRSLDVGVLAVRLLVVPAELLPERDARVHGLSLGIEQLVDRLGRDAGLPAGLVEEREPPGREAGVGVGERAPALPLVEGLLRVVERGPDVLRQELGEQVQHRLRRHRHREGRRRQAGGEDGRGVRVQLGDEGGQERVALAGLVQGGARVRLADADASERGEPFLGINLDAHRRGAGMRPGVAVALEDQAGRSAKEDVRAGPTRGLLDEGADADGLLDERGRPLGGVAVLVEQVVEVHEHERRRDQDAHPQRHGTGVGQGRRYTAQVPNGDVVGGPGVGVGGGRTPQGPLQVERPFGRSGPSRPGGPAPQELRDLE